MFTETKARQAGHAAAVQAVCDYVDQAERRALRQAVQAYRSAR